MVRLFVLWVLVVGGLFAVPVDISFVVLDLKYNAVDGVKVCEIQPGSYSKFKGYDMLVGETGAVANRFTEAVDQYVKKAWYLEYDMTDREIKKKLQAHPGWEKASEYGKLLSLASFKAVAKQKPKDPKSIDSYHGLVYVRPKRVRSRDDFYHDYPGVILMDGALFPFNSDKYLTNQVMSEVPEAAKLKPAWGLYEKKFSDALVRKILNDIPSDILVIKPRRATRGKGVIIVEREKLRQTLNLILNKKDSLKDYDDNSYRYWSKDPAHEFLVEGFAVSDPVVARLLDNKLYDGTMRVVLLMTYSDGKAHLDWIEGHWKLPEKSIHSSGTLIEKHRSYAEGGHYAEVDEGTKAAVIKDLEYGFIPLYLKMLGVNNG